jgi:arylsulfatase A-like enzyme
MRFYNTQARRWLLPMENYFSDLEYQTLCSMYDAEVAYQDHLLAQFLAELDSSYHRENTIVIMVADHGEMLGEHRIMGHGLGVYQELVHVPLIVRSPKQAGGNRIKEPVSTTYLFHTVLDAAGFEVIETNYSPEVDIKNLSLLPLAGGKGIPATSVFSEAFAPNNVLQIMSKHEPMLLELRHVKATNRAVYSAPYKLIQIEGVRDELYHPKHDPRETQDLSGETDPAVIRKMSEELGAYLERSLARRPDGWTQGNVNLDDEKLAQRMRGLGYIE